jgi:hypothetical protein
MIQNHVGHSRFEVRKNIVKYSMCMEIYKLNSSANLMQLAADTASREPI